MSELVLARTIAVIIVGAVAALALGDYLGYKFGQKRVAGIMGLIALIVIILFAIYAAVVA